VGHEPVSGLFSAPCTTLDDHDRMLADAASARLD
jgi:hypothetical protein